MSDVAFQQFDASELGEWLARTRAGYISERVAAGDTLAEAAANADEVVARTFPGGTPVPGQLVGKVVHDGVAVGEFWIGPFGEDPKRWWVWDIVIDEERRGQGFGRKTMLLIEQMAVANGAESVGLNVFAHNAVARGLYQSLGYEETSLQMRKTLVPSPEELNAS